MKCFYHSADLDGHCSGALVKAFNINCELIGINYDDEFPWETIGIGETVWMVDFGLQPFSDMLRLQKMCGLIWIDHHKSALEEYAKALSIGNEPIAGLRRDGIGACQLVYEFLTNKQKIPTYIKLLAEYDVWNHLDPRTLAFQYGMRFQKK